MALTNEQKKERKRQRDAIREMAWEVAQGVARGDMNTVERVNRDGYPMFQFGPRIDGLRCDCGMACVPLPTFSARYGLGQTWFCVVCDLNHVVVACERVRAEVAPHTARPTPKRRGT